MKTIKDAVIELKGKIPDGCNIILTTSKGWQGGDQFVGKIVPAVFGSGRYFDAAGYIDGDRDYLIVSDKYWHVLCDKNQFESTAKRMGYINGYRWGVEYPTNGKRPELADDVLISVKNTYNKGEWLHERTVINTIWGKDNEIKVIAFRITDQRYKPTDEVSEIAESINKVEYVSEISKSKDFEMNVSAAEQNNSWCERGELPPVGVECEMKHEGVWIKCKPIGFDDGGLVCKLHVPKGKAIEIQFVPCYSCKFRPIRKHREKVIEAVDSLIHDYQAGAEIRAELLNVLYDAGMLVLPQDSGDTKD